jgi:drug/metabolite transporter (DMT)-like permease
MTALMTPRTATLIGLTAILMWSLLSVMTVATGRVPAFQLAAMTFAIGALVGSLTWIGRSKAVGALRQPLAAWAVGVGGLFGYHALYFLALRFAPPAEAGLLNYLWPLLIVLFSSLLPGERLAPHHIIGAVLGLAGTVLLFAGNTGSVTPGQVPGLIAAFVAAFVWATYSVLSRRLKSVPTDAVAGFCAVTALLAALVHGLVEVTVWPDTMLQWLSVIALGVGPVGAAFYAWDIGMKRGDIRVLGAASYATPLLSTAFLVMAGFAKASANIALAAVLIAGGGLIAARDMISKQSWAAPKAHPGMTRSKSSRRPPARWLVGGFRNLTELGALQLFRRETIKLLEAHDQRPPFVGVDAVGLALHHHLRMRVHAGDTNLDRREIAAPNLVLLRHLVHMRDLGLDLHRAFRGAWRCDRFAPQRRQAA